MLIGRNGQGTMWMEPAIFSSAWETIQAMGSRHLVPCFDLVEMVGVKKYQPGIGLAR
jgi:hypothetical protein